MNKFSREMKCAKFILKDRPGNCCNLSGNMVSDMNQLEQLE